LRTRLVHFGMDMVSDVCASYRVNRLPGLSRIYLDRYSLEYPTEAWWRTFDVYATENSFLKVLGVTRV
jgi:hypothetical protein